MKSDNFNAVKPAWIWIIAWVVLVVIATSVISCRFWEFLRADDPGSSTIRNIVLAAAAVIALPLAIWRSIVADRQADTAQKQSEIAERGLLNERYQKGAEMLGNSMISVRFGGINALERLAEEHPKDYHLLVMQLFCAFVVEPPEDDNGPKNQEENEDTSIPRARRDVQLIIELIGRRNKERRTIEREAGFVLDLSYADLSDIVFFRVDLSEIKFNKSDLSRAKFSRSFFKQVELAETNLSKTQIVNTDFSGSKFYITNLSGANFIGDLPAVNLVFSDISQVYLDDSSFEKFYYTNLSGTQRGAPYCEEFILTQVQLDQAVADSENPPSFGQIADADTGEPLVWRGKPLEKND